MGHNYRTYNEVLQIYTSISNGKFTLTLVNILLSIPLLDEFFSKKIRLPILLSNAFHEIPKRQYFYN